MDNLTEEDIKNLKNQFEIEERVVALLKFEEDITYFTEKLRRTTSAQYTTGERLKSNQKRELYWNNLATSFAVKYFGEQNIRHIDNNKYNNMNNTSEGSSSNSD